MVEKNHYNKIKKCSFGKWKTLSNHCPYKELNCNFSILEKSVVSLCGSFGSAVCEAVICDLPWLDLGPVESCWRWNSSLLIASCLKVKD